MLLSTGCPQKNGQIAGVKNHPSSQASRQATRQESQQASKEEGKHLGHIQLEPSESTQKALREHLKST